MAVSNRSKIILWSKAGGYCSFPDCRREMVREATLDDAAVLVGEIAHIAAQQHDGPRGAEAPPGGEIDGYQNLILLCGDHHHVIDTQVATYPVAKLLQIRTDHERWVRDTLSREQRFLGTCDEQEFVTERLVTTLLPVSRMPRLVFSAPCTATEPVVSSHLASLEMTEEVFPFVIRGGRLIAFNRLEGNSAFGRMIDRRKIRTHRSLDWWNDPDHSRWYMTLLNRSLNKLTGRKGLRLDKDHARYYFPPLDGDDGPGKRKVTYRTAGDNKSELNVAWRPRMKSTGHFKNYWEHRAVSLSFHRAAEAAWCLSVRPERRFTRDGITPVMRSTTGKRSTSRKSRMYNQKVMEEVHFWRDFLSDGMPRIILNYGAQQLVIDAEWLTTDVEWPAVLKKDTKRVKRRYEDDLFTSAEYRGLLVLNEDEVALLDESDDEFEEDE